MLYSSFVFLPGELTETIKVPVRTCKQIKQHIDEITEKCGLKIVDRGWETREPGKELDDTRVCDAVRQHNEWVDWIYESLKKWKETPPEQYEEMTPEIAKTFIYGLTKLYMPPERWSREYYKDEMQKAFDLMTKGGDDIIEWTAAKLTPSQAIEVIRLFENYLDRYSADLELPYGQNDILVDSDEYYWCSVHGAILSDDMEYDEEGSKCPECGRDEL